MRTDIRHFEWQDSSMGKSCCAVGCVNRYRKGCGLSFYRFPTDHERRARWIAAVDRKNWMPNEYSWLCSAHFVTGAKSNDPLSPDFVPTLFSHVESPIKRKAKRDLVRYERSREVKKRRIECSLREEAATALLQLGCDSLDVDVGIEETSDETQPSCSTMTEISGEQIVNLQTECQLLREENCRLKVSSGGWLNEESLKDDNIKVKFYTGLPSFNLLMTVFSYISAHVINGPRSSLTKFQQFLMVLVKLRLNLATQDMAYRFGVHQSSVSRNIRKWIDVMYIRLKPLIKWPEREELLKTMPMDFKKNFKKCVIIIDCFEVFCERPTALMARAQTWSNYKQHNTVKFLIGIAPQGVVSFISKGWGGRVSDVHLTQNCGLLQNLLPGDLVLADRGFTVQESVGMYCAEVKIPPFTRGKKQLSKFEIDTSRQLSHVRIHVERVIGVIRQKYTILQSRLPINMIMCAEEEDISIIDKVITVCCALCNCCESVVSFE